MLVCKWGNSLGVRLPVDLVRELGLQAGDEIELIPADGALQVVKVKSYAEQMAEFLAECKARPAVPSDYVWSREDAYAPLEHDDREVMPEADEPYAKVESDRVR